MTQPSQNQEIHVVLLSKELSRVYPAVSLVLGAAAFGIKASLYAAYDGLEAVKKDSAEKLQFPGFPPVSKFVKDAVAAGAYICACAPTKDLLPQLGVTQDKVFEGVRLEDMVTFLNRALPAAKNGGIVTFV